MIVEVELTDFEVKVLAHVYDDVEQEVRNVVSRYLGTRTSQLARKIIEGVEFNDNAVLTELFDREGYKNAATIKADSLTDAEARGE